jgi:hypothetical protein
MTVQELIDELNKVEDKSQTIYACGIEQYTEIPYLAFASFDIENPCLTQDSCAGDLVLSLML